MINRKKEEKLNKMKNNMNRKRKMSGGGDYEEREGM